MPHLVLVNLSATLHINKKNMLGLSWAKFKLSLSYSSVNFELTFKLFLSRGGSWVGVEKEINTNLTSNLVIVPGSFLLLFFHPFYLYTGLFMEMGPNPYQKS